MSSASPARRRGANGLRANALAGLIILLIEYSLGISVNLYPKLPSSDAGKTLFAGLGAAVGNGPVLLAFHAVLGTLLLLTGVGAVVRASRLGARPLIALSAGALLATVVAWLSGSQFVGHEKNSASLTMALAAAVAILCYALVIFVLGAQKPPRPSGAGGHAAS